ncbi:MAG TPA: hypothetical protein VNE17_02765 [Nitrolancea sp.]|nr:hypothetical protein [Nitrolancea sp.]
MPLPLTIDPGEIGAGSSFAAAQGNLLWVVTFSDGTDFNVDAVKANFTRILHDLTRQVILVVFINLIAAYFGAFTGGLITQMRP